MYLDKVEMRFVMDQVHTSLVLLFTIVVTDLVLLRGSNGLAHVCSLMSYPPPLLVKLGQCTLSCLKLQETIIYLLK